MVVSDTVVVVVDILALSSVAVVVGFEAGVEATSEAW